MKKGMKTFLCQKIRIEITSIYLHTWKQLKWEKNTNNIYLKYNVSFEIIISNEKKKRNSCIKWTKYLCYSTTKLQIIFNVY